MSVTAEQRRLAAYLLNRAAAYRADADHLDAPKTQWHTSAGARMGSDRELSAEMRRAVAVELETAVTDLMGSNG